MPFRDGSLTKIIHDEHTATVKDMFITALKRLHNVSVVCEVLKIGRKTVYEWRDEDKEFAARWEEAKLYSCEALESAAYVKLTEAYTDGRRRLSMPEEKLTEFVLTGMFPDKYRQKYGVDIEINQQINFTIDWTKIPQEILDGYNANQLTLQDVYNWQIQHAEQKEPATSEDGCAEGSGTQGSNTTATD